MLLDYRKVVCVLPQLAVSRCQDFWVSKRKECSSSRPSSGPPAAFPAATLGWGRAGATGSRAEHREFSGLLLSVLLSPHCFCWESSGSKSQTPLLPPPGTRITEPSSAKGECPSCLPLYCCCFSASIESAPSVPLPQVPNAGQRTELSGSLKPLVPSPGAHCCLAQWSFFICLAPHPHSSVTGFRILWVCFPFFLRLPQSLFLSPKSATLSSSC